MTCLICPYFIIPFVTSLLCVLVFERVLHAIFLLFFRSVFKDDIVWKAKQTRAETLITAFLQLVSAMISNALWILSSFVSNFISVFAWVLLIGLILVCLNVTYEQYPEIWVGCFAFYNNVVQPFYQVFVIYPLQIFNVVFRSVIPVWNVLVWFAKKMLEQGLLPIFIREFNTFSRASVAIAMMFQHLGGSSQNYVQALLCENNACLDSPVVFDFVSPLGDVKNIAVMGVELTANVCGPMRIPVALFLYPLLDKHFAEGVHNLINSVLYLFVQLPISTYKRCQLPGASILLCTPDSEPFFLYLVSGFTYFGRCFDAWLRVLVQTFADPSKQDCLISVGNVVEQVLDSSFLTGPRTMVGLPQGVIALTNGSIGAFHMGDNNKVVVQAWGENIDVRFGVANVFYSSVDTSQSTLFGCRCVDVEATGIRVLCSFLSYQGIFTNTTEIVFQDNTWLSSFTCAAVEISVKSVRFSVRRYDTNMDMNMNCIARGQCAQVDATVWLVPKCGVLKGAACNPQAIGTTCYPFCLATRVSGSQNSRLVFVNAQTWRTGRQVLFRNCNNKGPEATDTHSFMYNVQSVSNLTNKTLLTFANGNTCEFGPNSVSFVADAVQAGVLSPYMRSGIQPFAISGETILVGEDAADGRGVVHVERLTGNEQDVFSLRGTGLDMEAAPRQNIPRGEFEYNPLQQVYVPLEFQARRVYATSSARYFFYAQSPNLGLFSAYFDYCRDSSQLQKLQLMMFSSYAPMRIYRVRAYCLDNCIGISASVTLESFRVENLGNCSQRFNASIVSLEYVDEENIAVLVQEGDASYNAELDYGTGSQFKVYWLNPDSMQLRSAGQGKWQGNVLDQQLGQCLSIISPPRLGTLSSLLVVIPLHLVRFGVNSVLYTPGVIDQWRRLGSQCPALVYGHYMMKTCASDMYLLDSYFSAVDEGTEIVWGVLAYLADLISSEGVQQKALDDVLRGLSAYGYATMTLDQIVVQKEKVLETPIVMQLEGVWAVIRTQDVMAGMNKMSQSFVGMARFGYLAINRIGVQAVKRLVTESEAGMDAGVFWDIFSNAVYELQTDFAGMVTGRAKTACGGVRVMLGGNNPWADLAYRLCLTNVELADAIIRMFSVVFVEMPLVKCACVDASSNNPTNYMLTVCIPSAPESLQITLIDILGNYQQGQCKNVVALVQNSLRTLPDRWFQEVYFSLDALGSSIDYALVVFDKEAGQCTNYDSNPNVVVIVPEPVDYFQACGRTSVCRTKCQGAWDLFSKGLSAYEASKTYRNFTISTTTESLFFPYPVEEIVALGKVVSLSQRSECANVCTRTSDQCIVGSFFVESESKILVRTFCIPNNPLTPVSYGSVQWDAKLDASFGVVNKGYFLDEAGTSLVVMCVSASNVNSLVWVQNVRVTQVLDVSNLTSWVVLPLTFTGLRSMQLIDFITVQDKLVVSIGSRIQIDGRYQARKSCLFVDLESSTSSLCDLADDLWKGKAISEQPVKSDARSVLLLWGSPPQVLTLQWNNDTKQGLRIMFFYNLGSTDTFYVPLIPKNLILSKFYMQDTTNKMWVIYAHDDSHEYDWLQQLRVLYAGDENVLASASLYNSQTIFTNITMTTSCDGLDCRGCPTKQLEALCMNYQSCSVFKCVGTPVNLNRPLCDVGLLLKSYGSLYVSYVQGAYIVFSGVIISVMDVAANKKLELTWPDDAFFGYVCTAKDVSADLVAVFTSTLNSIIQISQTGGPLLQRASNIDPDVHVSMSLSIASMTAFFHQVLLLPIFQLTAARMVFVCQTQGLLATLSISEFTGYNVQISSPAFEKSMGSMAGMCLTQNELTQYLQSGDARVRGVFSNTAGRMLTSAAQNVVRMQIEPAMHMLDATLAYVSGVIYKFGDVLKGFNLKKCLLPNVYIKNVINCACGDVAVSIPSVRANEGLNAKAHWCTGTLLLTKADGSTQAVYNPYTYAQLLQKVDKKTLDAYLACIETSLECNAPNDVVLSAQGFNLLQVITKCRRNYVKKQWDQGAYLIYDAAMMRQHVMLSRENYQVLEKDVVGTCLLSAQGYADGTGCTDQFLKFIGKSSAAYWLYSEGETKETFVDGCLTFSGPSLAGDSRFVDCYENSGCELSGFIWSPSSNNSVPVAFSHVLTSAESEEKLQRFATKQYDKARNMVLSLLQELWNFNDPSLDVGLFSTEGDVLHQLLDCVYLGPYARMDYWPQNTELTGMFWARDETRGKTRRLDISTCSRTDSLPFTCGSPSRKALVRYFVQVILLNGRNGNGNLNALVRAWIRDLEQMWRNESRFGKYNNDTFLPPELEGDSYVYLNTSGIMNVIGSQLGVLWNDTLFQKFGWTLYLNDVNPSLSESLLYNWTQHGPQWVKDEARFDTTKPSMQYDEQEAMNPPTDAFGGTLWEQCHGALRQVLFTMPVYETNGSLYGVSSVFRGGGPDAIEKHVRDITRVSFEKSPLYALYQAKHKPSKSKVCLDETFKPTSAKRSVTFSDFTLKGEQVFQGDSIKGVNLLGSKYGALGSHAMHCFCGWVQEAGGMCVAPAVACTRLQMSGLACTYSVLSQNTSLLRELYQPVWECPELELSEHFGFLDREANEKWLSNNDAILSTSSEALLRYGAGGVRVGNLPNSLNSNILSEHMTLDQVWKNNVFYSNRSVGLELGVVHGCEDDTVVSQESLLAHFVDSLFPMAQGVVSSGTQAYCMRYAIELSKLFVLEALDAATTKLEIAQQRQIVDVWKRRCGSQVQLVAMCQSLRMYQRNDVSNDFCPRLWRLDDNSAGYITPQCLIGVNGTRFYDPCACDATLCDDLQAEKLVSIRWLNTNCTEFFEPFSIVVDQEMGWWDESGEDAVPAKAQNDWLKEFTNLLDIDELVARQLFGSDANSWLNTNKSSGQTWYEAEGFMSEKSVFCDFISDYWPDESVFPVGYHVTCPCMKQDIGYRSFDNVFALDSESDAENVFLRYLEDQTRDVNTMDANFGSSGLCRTTNFGYDMYEVNTMRICTRTAQDNIADVFVPRKNASVNRKQIFDMYECSTSSRDIPWSSSQDYSYYDASLFSVGTVPNLPFVEATYPETDRFFLPGNVAVIEREGWGETCSDIPLQDCVTSNDCATGFVCKSNVCLSVVVECVSHSDCRGNLMCSGVGKCVDPKISVWNSDADASEFKMQSPDCGKDTSYSMVGGSFWAHVPDLLESHGMCSYRHWREYLRLFEPSANCTCTDQGGDSCSLQAGKCTYYNFEEVQNNVQWWSENSSAPNRLKLQPTTCDRDYERMSLNGRELLGCVPVSNQAVVFISPAGAVTNDFSTSKFIQTYNNAQRNVAVRYMPFRSNVSYGFLGNSPNLATCGAVKQCYPDTFFVNGNPSMTQSGLPNRTLRSGSKYDAAHIFQCGFMGYLQNGQCQLDLKLFPLYEMFCVATPFPAVCASSVDTLLVTQACSQIKRSYSPSYATITDVNVPSLAKLFEVFVTPITLNEHTKMTDCVSYIYHEITKTPDRYYSSNLYYPFPFTVYEFPLSWLYQCVIYSKVVPDTNIAQRTWPCQAFSDRVANVASYQALRNQDSFPIYASRVAAGYKSADVENYLAAQKQASKVQWQQSVNKVRAAKFRSNVSVVPYCYQKRWWDLDSAQKDVTVQLLIYIKSQEICEANFNALAVTAYNNKNPNRTIETISDEDEILTLLKPSDYKEQSVFSNDLLDTMLQWGLAQIDAETLDYEKYVRTVNGTTQPPNPVQYFHHFPGITDISVRRLLNDVSLDINSRPYGDPSAVDGRAQCAQKDLVPLFPGTSDPILEQVKLCPIYQTGFFHCEYPPYSSGTSSVRYDWTDVMQSGTIETYFMQLYALVQQEYELMTQNVKIPSLAMTPLNFFQNETRKYSAEQKFVFDLTNVKKYQNNINPDTSVPFMCVLGQNNINFTQCTNPHFLALQQHVYKQYVKSGPVILKGNQQLDWTIDKTTLMNGMLCSFSSTERALNRTHLLAWLDNETVCNNDNTYISDRMCQYSAIDSSGILQNVTVVSPWSLGDWNPFEKCDVKKLDILSGYQEVVDSFCYYTEYCPWNKDNTPDFSHTYYRDNPYFDNANKQGCRYKQNQQTVNTNVRSDITYNLCRGNRFKDDSVCLHKQGMVGGSDGYPTQDFTGLYDTLPLEDLPEGLEDGYVTNPVFRGSATVNYGVLKMNPLHIGGHHIGMIIEDGVMKVVKLPLKSVSNNLFMSKWLSQNVSSWVPGLKAAWKADHYRYSLFTNTASKIGWDCPMRRRGVYAGINANFVPFLPSSQRSQRLFRQMTNESFYAHPIQKIQSSSRHFGNYMTSNGFCYCPVTEDVTLDTCSIPLSGTHDCSLRNTIRAIMGTQWTWSYTFTPRNKQNQLKPCLMQLDWPFISGELRDDSVVGDDILAETAWKQASDVSKKKCHVLDRLNDFQYMYVSVNGLKTSGYTTLDQGVCHTGRLQKIVLNEPRRCPRLMKDTFSSVIVCHDQYSGANTRAANYTVERLFSRLPKTYSMHGARQYCSKCTKTPTFTTRNGVPLDAESSFGVPFRRSNERVVAKDIKEALCRGNSSCLQFLNSSMWKKGVFFKTLMTDPGKLFNVSVNKSRGYYFAKKTRPNDDLLWNKSWVYCNSSQALASGVGCQGSISRSAWKSDRVGTCFASVRNILNGQPDPIAKTSVCDMSKKLTNLCKTIEEAKKLIQGANCLLSKDERCAKQQYVYVPSVWESSNQEFVYQTVQEYYELANQSVCPADVDTQKLYAQNGLTLLQCPATPVYAGFLLINSLRNMVFQICDMVFRLVGVLSNLLLTMLGSGVQAENYKSQFIVTWQEFQRTYRGITAGVSDIWIDTIMFNGVIGIYIQKLLQGACTQINSVLHYLHSVYCKLIVTYLPALFDALKNFGAYVDAGFTVVNDFITTILVDYLPEALIGMLAKGYDKLFQSNLIGNKQQAYSKADKVQIDSSKTKQQGILTKDSKATASVSKTTDKTALSKMASSPYLKYAGRAAMGLEVLAQGYMLWQQTNTAIKIKEALENMPDFWTIFDFTSIQKVIEDFAGFLLEDVFCYNYVDDNSNSSSGGVLPCAWIRLPQATSESVSQLIPYATQCWAEAQVQDIGSNTLYACTATSICCSDVFCSSKMVCIECPVSDNALYSSYGCNTMMQQCQCNVQKKELSRCLTHKDCYSTGSTCSLVTDVNEKSFGAIQCDECAAQPICLINSVSGVGMCSCMPETKKNLAMCKSSYGEFVLPKIDLLCGYSLTVNPQVYWNDVALIACSAVQRAMCVEVLSDTSTSVRLALSNVISSLTTSSTSRRLLAWPDAFGREDPLEHMVPDQVDDILHEDRWNETGTRCATAVQGYLHGNQEWETEARQCAYWKQVARKVFVDYDMADMREFDNIFLSSDDFAWVISQRRNLQRLLQKPLVFVDVLLYSSWTKPIRAIAKQYTGVDMRYVLKNFSTMLNQSDHHVLKNKDRFRLRPVNRNGRKILNYITDTDLFLDNAPMRASLKPPVEVRSFLSRFELWKQPSFDLNKQCIIIDVTYEIGRESITAVTQYFQYFTSDVKIINQHILSGFPDFTSNKQLEITEKSEDSNWSSIVFYFFTRLFNIRMQDVVHFFQEPCNVVNNLCTDDNKLSLQKLFYSLFYCNLDSVMFCNQKRADLMPAIVFIVFVYLILYWLCNLLGINFVANLYLLFTPLLILHRAYNVAPGCLPMIPTCLGDEIIYNANHMVPNRLQFPKLLDCTAPNTNTSVCSRKCSEVGFTTAQDPLVYAGLQLGLGGFVGQYVPTDRMQRLVDDNANTDAYVLCALVSSVMSMPLLLAAAGILFLLLSVIAFVVSLIPSFVSVLWNIILMNHNNKNNI